MAPKSPPTLTEEEPLENSESYDRQLGRFEKAR
jgi:hypothetical protein